MAELCPCGSVGVKMRMAVESTGTAFSDTSERPEILAETLSLDEKIIIGQGLTGSIDPSANRLRQGPYRTFGQVLMNISPEDLQAWIPRIFFKAASGNNYLLGDDPKTDSLGIDVLIDRDQVCYKYTELYVASAVIRGDTRWNAEEPQLLQMLVTLLGKDEEKSDWPDPAPPLSNPLAKLWITGDAVLNLGPGTVGDPAGPDAADYHFNSFAININNNLWAPTRNSLTPKCIRSLGRSTTLQLQLPLCETVADNLHFTPYEGPGSLSFLSSKNLGNNDSETTFNWTRLVNRPRVSPRTRGRNEIPQVVTLRSFRNANDDPSMSAVIRAPAAA